MPSKDSVNFLVSKDWNAPLSGLQNPSSMWPYQALPEFARKNWGGSTNRMPVWQQKFVSQPPDQISPNHTKLSWGGSKNKILLPKIFGRRVRPLVQRIPSQPCPGHCCCAQEWVRCSQTLKQIYILCIPLHLPERSCTHWRTHTMVTSIRWTSPCLFHQQMKSHGHGQKPMTIIPSIRSCKTVATLQSLPSFPPRALR